MMNNEAVIMKTANAATYGGSASAFFFGLTAHEFAAFGGLVIAVIGLLINIWFKAQHLKIAREKARKTDFGEYE